MSRSISVDGLQAMFAQETADAILVAATLHHDSFSGPLRFVRNFEAITYNSETYLPLPFEVQLAPDIDDALPTVRLRMDAIDRSLIAEIRTFAELPEVDIEVFRVSPAGAVTLEVAPSRFAIASVSYDDSGVIDATLTLEADYLNEPAVKDRFDPTIAPGLF